MLKQNRYLVDHSSVLLSVYNGAQRSGSGATIRCALKKKREVIIINPVSRNILLQGLSDN